MKKIRITIERKLQMGFAALIILFILNGVISVIVLQNNKSKAARISNDTEPSIKALDDFKLLLIQSKMLTTNWVYLRSKEDDKQDLKTLHENTYPTFKKNLTKIVARWEDTTQAAKINKLTKSFEALLDVEKEIMNSLNSFEAYEDPMMKLDAESKIEETVLPQTAEMIAGLDKIKEIKMKEKREAEDSLEESTAFLTGTIVTLGIILVIISLGIALYLGSSITKPIIYIKNVVNNLGKGKLEEVKDYGRNDEIGDMVHSVNNLVQGLRYTSEFARNVGNSNFESDFNVLSEHDELGLALISMRDNLKKAAEEDKRRAWATNGLAEIGGILRSNYNTSEELYDNVLRFVVKYLHVNQGGLYEIIEDDGNKHLELRSCYAYERKKFQEKRIEIGEGLLGQCVLENDKILLTDIPPSYVAITSGLGEATPSCILIAPLKVVDNCVGVIELASFHVLEEHEIAFVEKISESIASTLSTIKINERTKKLLEDSQVQSEQLRSQEEEMRQNMEELHATQEEMQRKQADMEQKLKQALQNEKVLVEKLQMLESVNNN
ncbi:MAG: GAF domain-containing protein [Cytophagales bacterium]|nr:GAF domain-containing protein [Cytophagales bacterium]